MDVRRKYGSRRHPVLPFLLPRGGEGARRADEGLPWKITLRRSARLGSAASEIVPAGRSRLRTYVSTKSTICLKNPSPPQPLSPSGARGAMLSLIHEFLVVRASFIVRDNSSVRNTFQPLMQKAVTRRAREGYFPRPLVTSAISRRSTCRLLRERRREIRGRRRDSGLRCPSVRETADTIPRQLQPLCGHLRHQNCCRSVGR